MAQQNTRFAETSQATYEGGAGRVREAYHQTENLVKQNPGSSALLTFGIGVGLGLALTAMLMPSRRKASWYESHRPEWLDQKHLTDTIAGILPSAVSRRFS